MKLSFSIQDRVQVKEDFTYDPIVATILDIAPDHDGSIVYWVKRHNSGEIARVFDDELSLIARKQKRRE